MLPLIRDSALWTMGSDNADGDWEAAWKRRIEEQPGHSKGSGTPAHPPCVWKHGLSLRDVVCHAHC